VGPRAGTRIPGHQVCSTVL